MTKHQIIQGDSKRLSSIPDNSVHLIVTSPPYPMIEMWDEMFNKEDKLISYRLSQGKGIEAFYRMHNILNKTWEECNRVLIDGGFICINIGDATRTIDGNFQLYSNHTQVINYFTKLGYSVLPDIHWRKQSNAPNKFMGSGMYPAGAYVTYEHEYILIFRKQGKREFTDIEKELRRKSAYFWEERNIWFSDLWEIKGTKQTILNNKGRERNASFPIEIPYRLVNMYSIEGDIVLDPFAGLGTINLACIASNRNSIGVDIIPEICELARENINNSKEVCNKIIRNRIDKHSEFISMLPDEKKDNCYYNKNLNMKVKTKQETDIKIDLVYNITSTNDFYTCNYEGEQQ